MMLSGEMNEIGEPESEKQFSILLEQAAFHGYTQYEISNFCRENYYSRHNSNYWKQVPYIGLGPSSHSFNGDSRQWNVSDVKRYIESINKETVPFEEEKLDDKTRYNEYLMTSLRTIWGADLDELEKKHNKEARDYLLNLSSRFIKYGMMEIVDNRKLVLTNQGKLISDNIISELMMV
jgi:oxygen-independent coproporphyrinogen-3 oxidase